MDFETMLKLVNAGFTKEEIMKFAAPAPVPTPATPAPATPAPATPAPVPTPATPAPATPAPATPAPVPTPATPAPDLTALTGKVDALTDIIAKMQLANAKNASSQGAGDTGVMGAVQSFFGKPQGGV